MLESPLNCSILKRAQNKGLAEIVVHDLREYSLDKHRHVDDYPFGGEAGMVMQIEPVDRCISALKAERDYDEVIFVTPDGEKFDQRMANTLSLSENLIILCGHYKGIDYRIREHFITKEITIGDYVLTGGELHRRHCAPHSRSHRRRAVGAERLLSGQLARAACLYASGGVQGMACARRAAVGASGTHRRLEARNGAEAHPRVAPGFA